MRWYGKDGYWRTRCGRFAIEPAGKGFKLFDNLNSSAGAYRADSIKEAKQLASRVAKRQAAAAA
jgi:hypothetical protein